MRVFLAWMVVIGLAGILPLAAQNQHGPNQNGEGSDRGTVFIPGSSVENAGEHGSISHTNHSIHYRGNPQATTPGGFLPKQLATAYKLTPSWPNVGLGKTIAIVDAYDYPTAKADFAVFAAAAGLPCTRAGGCLQVVYASGKQPKANCGWAQEAALDIEWAYGMAPMANIVLVEANSNSNADLFAAVQVATNLVVKAGGGAVSMSWGGSEASTQSQYEKYFTGSSKVIYFASSGDTGGKTIYPGTSPNVISAGGTSIKLNADLTIASETGWSGSGGGSSPYFARPAYQAGISSVVGTQRGVPDFSFVGDPYTGVSVYDSTSCQGMSGWMVFGGTSVSSPSLAGIVSAANPAATTAAELAAIYSGFASYGNFNDILSGTAGKFTAKTGWDFVTGVGSNKGLQGK